jgi:1-deoxy-D-xylulose-5-phosphate synthase
MADSEVLSFHRVKRLGLPDRFIEHGSQADLKKQVGIDEDSIVN